MQRLIVRMIEGRAGPDAVLPQHPASDLWFPRATMIGERVAAEARAKKLALHHGTQRAFGSETGGICCRYAPAASTKPRHPILGVGDDPITMIGRDRLPEIKFRVASHPTIVSRRGGTRCAQRAETGNRDV